MLHHATVDTFKAGLRGELWQPDDAGYEAARRVYNGMIDRRPRYIVRCGSTGCGAGAAEPAVRTAGPAGARVVAGTRSAGRAGPCERTAYARSLSTG